MRGWTCQLNRLNSGGEKDQRIFRKCYETVELKRVCHSVKVTKGRNWTEIESRIVKAFDAEWSSLEHFGWGKEEGTMVCGQIVEQNTFQKDVFTKGDLMQEKLQAGRKSWRL